MASPVGSLILDAEARAKKKASRSHTSIGACGCEVTVTWFSENSRANKIEPCAEHRPQRRER